VIILNRIIIPVVLISIFIIFSGCPEPAPATNTETNNTGGINNTMDGEIPEWMEFQLKDVLTGQNFKISDFKGKPVLVESFAVWCPSCLAQQKISKDLKAEEGDSIIHISIDTDPNENEQTVINHANENGFDWRYAVAPSNFTQQLIDEFGLGVVSAPSVPVILICEDQSYRLLERGVKSADILKAEIAGC